MIYFTLKNSQEHPILALRFCIPDITPRNTVYPKTLADPGQKWKQYNAYPKFWRQTKRIMVFFIFANSLVTSGFLKGYITTISCFNPI